MPITPPVRRALTSALGLVFPSWCAGCDAPDAGLCAACRASLEPTPFAQVLESGLQVVSALSFDGVPARVIRAFKEDGRTGLARPLGASLAAAMFRVAPTSSPSADPDGIAIVPVPSSRAALRRRGYRVTELLTRRAGHRPRRLLLPRRAAADQRGLGRDARAANVAGTFRTAHRVASERAVIVDDVVTTGATLDEAARVLRAAGVDVIGAVTLAATPRRIARDALG